MANFNEGLVLHLKLDEIPKAQGSNSSGNIGSGTVKGNPQLVPDEVFGSRLRFNAGEDAKDAIDLENPTELQIIGNQTIEMWLRPNDFNERRNPYAKAYGGEGTITQEKDGRLTYYYGTSGANAKSYQAFQTGSSIPLNQWTHIAVVRDLDAGKLYWYINSRKSDETSATYPSAKSSSLNAYIGQGYVKNYTGSIANLRIYNRALSAEEIAQDMLADKTAAASFAQSHPLAFRLYDDDDQQLLAIDDNLDGRTLRLEIDNTSSRAIQLSPSNNGNTPTADNHHFELRFRPDTLSKISQSQIVLAEEKSWRMSPAQANINGTISFYFLNTATDITAQTLDPAERITLTLRRITADAAGGTRGTRVELTYQQLTYANDTTPLSGSRMQHLNIVNHRGRKNIPLHVSFVGSNTILNDGQSANELTLHMTNILKGQALPLNPSAIDNRAPSRFVLSFDVQAEDEEKEWALGTTSQVQAIEVTLTNTALRRVVVAQKILAKANDLMAQAMALVATVHPLFAGTLGQAVPVLETARQELAQAQAELEQVRAVLRGGKVAQKALAKANDLVAQATTLLATMQTLLVGQSGQAVPVLETARQELAQAQAELEQVRAALTVQTIQWSIQKETQGESPQWILTTPNKTGLAPEEIIQLNLTNIITSLPTGYTNLYLHYENIPGYWDGQVVIHIEKSPLLYRGQRVGIGLIDPKAPLHVSGRAGSDAAKGKSDSGFVIIGDAAGKHLAIDDNEILAKANGKTSSTLYLQAEGGLLSVGGPTEIKDSITVNGSALGETGAYSTFKKNLLIGEISGKGQKANELQGQLAVFAKYVLSIYAESDHARGTWLQLNNTSASKNNRWSMVATGTTNNTNKLPGPGKLAFFKGNEGPSLLTLDGSGNVGIGTDDPKGKLDVSGDIIANGNVISSQITTRLSKQFQIDHPSKPGYQLRHSCLEGPEVGVYYRGTGQLENGEATVILPDYFEALTRENGRTVQLTAIGRDPFLLSYETVQNGRFKVYGTHPNGAFSWQVTAVRADVAELEVEVE